MTAYRLRGKPVRIIRSAKVPMYGDCRCTKSGGYVIRINSKLAGVDAFVTAGHELLHAAFPDLDESAVTEAEAMFYILWHHMSRHPELYREDE